MVTVEHLKQQIELKTAGMCLGLESETNKVMNFFPRTLLHLFYAKPSKKHVFSPKKTMIKCEAEKG